MQPVQPPRAELAALRNLRNRSDLVIRRADKGGAFVVWEKELYLSEAHRQLSDGRFYQRIPEDATKRNHLSPRPLPKKNSHDQQPT